jgi:hypothetical protein
MRWIAMFEDGYDVARCRFEVTREVRNGNTRQENGVGRGVCAQRRVVKDIGYALHDLHISFIIYYLLFGVVCFGVVKMVTWQKC